LAKFSDAAIRVKVDIDEITEECEARVEQEKKRIQEDMEKGLYGGGGWRRDMID
jgi:hypothetical protein